MNAEGLHGPLEGAVLKIRSCIYEPFHTILVFRLKAAGKGLRGSGNS